MVIRYYGCFVPACDGCDERLDAEEDLREAIQAIRVAGWKSEKHSGVWYDFCPECAKGNDTEEAEE